MKTFILLSLLLAACSNYVFSPYEAQRNFAPFPACRTPEMNGKDREIWIQQWGLEYKFEHRQPFREGRIVVGMPVDMVYLIYGVPDWRGKGNRKPGIVIDYRTYDWVGEYRHNGRIFGAIFVRDGVVTYVTGKLREKALR